MSSSEEQWEVTGKEVMLEHPFLRVHMEQVRLPDGRVIKDWPIVDARDYVMVVAWNPTGEMLILEGYKHGLGRSSWQVVGGYIEVGDEPLETAKRELLEEAGCVSDDWAHLGTFVVDANRRVSWAHIFLARNARPTTKLESDDLELTEMRWVSAQEAASALSDGRVGIISSAVAIALALPLW
jgi:8-oxo-dGTP pyrophosphatase MutT (NUDIX family)